jgi:alkanesulfonate monooxygenase SsuD/methylene tetrahydromethanopterin reductase-like flavin-dependent oxidoreductase (luciferase family)
MRFAAGIPNVLEYGDPELLVDLAGRAEAAGWDGFFVWDHLVYQSAGDPVADPWTVVSAIAGSTSRIRLGVMVVALARRRPWKVARETATLDVLSRGRLVVGVGLGSLGPQEFEAFGEDPDPRVRADRLDEGLEILAGLWTGERFAYEGRYYRVRETAFRPVPIQRPPPVWVAARWPNRRPFRRAARWDGVFATHDDVGWTDTMTTAQLRELLDYTSRHRTDPARPFDVVIEGITPADPSRAAELVAPYADAGLTWWVEKLGWFRGSVAEMRDRIEAGPPSSARPASGAPSLR